MAITAAEFEFKILIFSVFAILARILIAFSRFLTGNFHSYFDFVNETPYVAYFSTFLVLISANNLLNIAKSHFSAALLAPEIFLM